MATLVHVGTEDIIQQLTLFGYKQYEVNNAITVIQNKSDINAIIQEIEKQSDIKKISNIVNESQMRETNYSEQLQYEEYKINKRPKDDITNETTDEFKLKNNINNINNINNTNNINKVSIFLWFEWPLYDNYQIGSHGQKSFSFASPNDIIVAYNYANIDKDWFSWLLKINQLSETQFVWKQPECETLYAKDILNDVLLLKQISTQIQTILAKDKNCRINIKPYSGQSWFPEIHPAMDKIKSYVSSPENQNIRKCIASPDWIKKFANKSCLHRCINNVEQLSLFETHDIFTINGLSECKGYICFNKKEILLAYDKLIKQIGHRHVVIKDCYGDGGVDIFFYQSKHEIVTNFVWDDEFECVALEENLLFTDTNGKYKIDKVEWIGVQFYDNEVVGCGIQKFVDNSVFIGSERYTNKAIEKKLKQIATNVMKNISAEHVGGFDFAVQYLTNKNIYNNEMKTDECTCQLIEPNIYLIDMNTGRHTEITQTQMIQKKFGFDHENKFWVMRNLYIKKNASFKVIRSSYSELLFNLKNKNGVYFHSFHPKNKCIVVSIFGDNQKHVFDMLNTLMSIEFVMAYK